MDSAGASKTKPQIISWRVGAAPSKQPKKKLPSTKEQLPSERPKINTAKYATVEQHHQLILRLSSPSINELTESLDPFCPLPCVLTHEDRALLHSYLLEIPARAYGTRPDTIVSAVRDVSFPISLASSLTLWWMLVAADALLTSGERAESVAWRKRRAYRLLSGYIEEAKGEVSDEVMGGIIMAAITEARLSDPIACHAHLKGYEAAIDARGGLRTSLACRSIPPLRFAHLMPYLVCPPVPGDEVSEDSTQNFVTFLSSKIRQKGFSEFSVDVLPPEDVYQLRNRAAAKVILRSVLVSYLRPSERRAIRFMDEAASFLSLFWVTLTLSLCKTSDATYNGHFFASRVITIFENSTAFGIETALPLLTDQGFMWVVLSAIQDFYRMTGNCNEETELQPVVDGIDALRVFRTLGRDARMQVKVLLFRILSGQDTVVLPG
ncbi:uncharacterized protein BDV17DRAFT_289655 [Aspergillus undulatus]|uniref:uncharacterized protein n=1 Tax=Aspergillus undulatus TaxID=1810928 RepID=UPI003CCCA317